MVLDPGRARGYSNHHCVVFKNTVFPIYEEGQLLRLYTFRGSIPLAVLVIKRAYGLILPFLPLHSPDYSDAWEVPYSPGG
jgi:hypothetical protein